LFFQAAVSDVLHSFSGQFPGEPG